MTDWVMLIVTAAILGGPLAALIVARRGQRAELGTRTAAASAGAETLDSVFNPGKRHELRQREVQYALRDETRAAVPGDEDIDLDRGIARMRPRRQRPTS